MCLKTVELNLKCNWLGQYTGIGYKVLTPDAFKDGKFVGKRSKRWSKRWKSAQVSLLVRILNFGLVDRIKEEYSENGDLYDAGFHIFLNKEDALKYESYSKLVKVEYRDIISFGTNQIYDNITDKFDGPCVVARYLRILEVLN